MRRVLSIEDNPLNQAVIQDSFLLRKKCPVS